MWLAAKQLVLGGSVANWGVGMGCVGVLMALEVCVII